MIKNIEKFNKQIYFIKVIIGEACPFRCKYCFVDKDNSLVIKEETLERIIDLLLYSPGGIRTIRLYQQLMVTRWLPFQMQLVCMQVVW